MNIQLSKPAFETMTTLTEFTCFPKLPAELRMEIWKRVPRPERIVGWVPCGNCRNICRRKSKSREEQDGKPLARQRCMDSNHPNWLVKYVVHPRKDAIFAPLHACRESREFWKTQYFTPSRHMIVNEEGFDIPVQFNVPFLSYEHDIFTMFGAWSSTTIFDMETPMDAQVEPFIGLDRARIEHGGYSEILDLFFPASTLFEVNELPALKRLSLITMGPQPQDDEDQEDGVLMQMHACVAEHYDCQIIDIVNPEVGENSTILNECRPRRKPIHWYTKERQFDDYYNYWKAWLWHVVEGQAHFLIKSNRVSWSLIVNFALAEILNGTVHLLRKTVRCIQINVAAPRGTENVLLVTGGRSLNYHASICARRGGSSSCGTISMSRLKGGNSQSTERKKRRRMDESETLSMGIIQTFGNGGKAMLSDYNDL